MKKNIDLIIDGIAPEKVMYDTDNHSLVVLYPAQREFKRGDILTSNRNKNVIVVFKEYHELNTNNDVFHSIYNTQNEGNYNWTASCFRHATESEIEQFDNDLKSIGKKWNRDTLEIEDIDISEIVVDLETACEYLEKSRPHLSELMLTMTNGDFRKYTAQITLQLMREAWNRFDEFEVDWNNIVQRKNYPQVHVFDECRISSSNWMTYASIDTSCYSFLTQERALQFGNQFKELFKTAMGM